MMVTTLDAAWDWMTMPEQELDEDLVWVRDFIGGDEAAFSRLVTKYRRQVFGLAYRYTRNKEEADDLAQETFIKAYENIKSFRGEASFKSWLLRITTNLSINHVKSGRIRKDVGEEPDLAHTSEEAEAHKNMVSQEKIRQLKAAIQKLPPKQQKSLVLKAFGEMTCEEVAQSMNCSVGTVKANVFNGLKKLKSIMGASS